MHGIYQPLRSIGAFDHTRVKCRDIHFSLLPSLSDCCAEAAPGYPLMRKPLPLQTFTTALTGIPWVLITLWIPHSSTPQSTQCQRMPYYLWHSFMLAMLCCQGHHTGMPESLMLICGAQSECSHMRVSGSTFFSKKDEFWARFKSRRCCASSCACLFIRTLHWSWHLCLCASLRPTPINMTSTSSWLA